MTRRKFITRLAETSAAIICGTCWLAKKAVPRRFVRAVRLENYPGPLGTLGKIFGQGKWSG